MSSNSPDRCKGEHNNAKKNLGFYGFFKGFFSLLNLPQVIFKYKKSPSDFSVVPVTHSDPQDASEITQDICILLLHLDPETGNL